MDITETIKNGEQPAPVKDLQLSRTLWAFLILVTMGFVLYAGTFGAEWTYDDLPVIVENPDVQSWAEFWKDSRPGRPVRELSYLIDHALFGLEPSGWHVQSIFWHGLNAWLVFVLVMILGGGRVWAWCAALLFLCHPVQVEVVAQVSHRKDSLALAASLVALLAYIKGLSSARHRLLMLVCAFALAMVGFFAKQNAIAIFAVFMAYEWFCLEPKQRFALRRPAWAIPVVAIFFIGVALYLVNHSASSSFTSSARGLLLFKANYFGDVDLFVYALMLLKSWCFLFLKLVAPVGLSIEYHFPVPTSWLDPWVLAGGFLVVAVLSAFWVFRTQAILKLGLAWFLLFWLPTSNVWPLTYFAADRYLYAPSVGFFLIVGALLATLYDRNRMILFGVMITVCLGMASLSWNQAKVWRTEMSLWQRAVEVNPRSPVALNNLGWALLQKKKTSEALRYFHAASEANPYFPRAWNNLAWVYEGLGDRNNAETYYRKTIETSRYLPGFTHQAERIRAHLKKNYGMRDN